MTKSFDPRGPVLRSLTTAITNIGHVYRELLAYSPAASSVSRVESLAALQHDISAGEASLYEGTTITVPCIFYPALLLRRGWWEGGHIEIPEDRGPIQRWLTYGMFEWAPSWEFPIASGDRAMNVLPAQAGQPDGDESASLTILIIGPQLVGRVQAVIKNQLDEFGRIAFWSKVTGRLVQTTRLAQDPSLPSDKLGRDPSSYALLVHEADSHHAIEPDASHDADEYPIYSGYLWKCLVPERWVYDRHHCLLPANWDPGSLPLRISDAYFVWEHTNLTSPEAIVYNLVSINQKIEYLEQVHRTRFRLLEKSCRVVSGQQPVARSYLERLLGQHVT